MSATRFLQNTAGGDDPVEFVAFLVWYIFLVMCCLIPTCCAYRRRRIMERRLAEQQATMQQRLQQSNLLFLSNLESGGPSLERVRTQLITEDLTSTTMRLESHHFVDGAASAVVAVDDYETRNDQKEDMEAQMENYEAEEHIGFIKLPKSANTSGDDETNEQQEQAGSRLVSDTCTICLCQYIEGESITWSTRPECVHAFHTQCIISWLAKQDQVLQCPVCRQEFCSRSFLPAVRQEDEFLRTIQQALLLTQMYGGRVNGRNLELGDIQLITNGRRIPENLTGNPPSNVLDTPRHSNRNDGSNV